jgi:phosphoribosyl 1,2-cyclic phosphodiesterase
MLFDDTNTNSDVTPLPVRPASGVEFIFLGTGTSGSLPNVSCLTAPEGQPPCKTCLSTLNPEGKKNIRRNTSGVLRIEGRDGKTKYVLQPQSMPDAQMCISTAPYLRTIVIDVGKNFQAAAVEWFPKYGLRRIDAVLITHAHADGT